MEKFFKFKWRRDSGALKVVFSADELKSKPIKYWANVGYIPKHSKLNRLIKSLKSQVDIKWANNIEYLTYYAGSKIIFPYHVNWGDSGFEFTLYSSFGDGKPYLNFARKVSSNNSRFTDEEIEKMKKFMENESHLIMYGLSTIRKLMNGDEKDYTEIRQRLKAIEMYACKGFENALKSELIK